MSQLRQDPVTGHWVAIATERAKRPSAYARPPSEPAPRPKPCPFCPGHEFETPPEVEAERPAGTAKNGPGWRIRVVPNLFPVFEPANRPAVLSEAGIYRVMEGLGVHEVVVLSPSHMADLGTLPNPALRQVIRTYVARYRANCARGNLQYLLIVSNHGREAGASIEHPHSQIFGLPIVPPAVEEELRGVAEYRRVHGRCIYCEIIRYEIATGDRVAYENPDFLVYAPFASRLPFETSIIPRWHTARFEEMTPEQQGSFADAVHQLAGRLTRGLNDPPFNFYVHTAPCHAGPELDYHWHLELLPRLTIQAGFEWGSGIMIDVTAPEDAAAFLRGVALPADGPEEEPGPSS